MSGSRPSLIATPGPLVAGFELCVNELGDELLVLGARQSYMTQHMRVYNVMDDVSRARNSHDGVWLSSDEDLKRAG